MDLYTTGLSIGDLARRTGIGISTLRAWERRHGFPVAQRLPSGHRRYTEQDATAIMEVERERHSGSTLEAALSRARTRDGLQRSSLFATLRQALPHTAPAELSKRTMLAISRAIEDEAAASADLPVLCGAFQDARFWRLSADRWRDLSRGATAAVVLGGFRQSRHRGSVYEVAAPAGAPVLREWAVICDSPTLSACLVGIERLGRRPSDDSTRRFEALWTVEPLAVRATARSAIAVATGLSPGAGLAIGARLQEPVRTSYDSIRVATTITNRIVAYLDRR